MAQDANVQERRSETVLRHAMILLRQQIKRITSPGYHGAATVTIYAQNGKVSTIECNDKQTHQVHTD